MRNHSVGLVSQSWRVCVDCGKKVSLPDLILAYPHHSFVACSRLAQMFDTMPFMTRSVVLLTLLTLNGATAEWPQLLGPTRDGTSIDTTLATKWPKEGPKVLWRLKAGAGWSGPVVSSNRVVLFHRLKDREAIECLNATNGTPLWRNEYPATYRDDFGFGEGPRATPAISGRQILTFGADGILTCWDLLNGTNVWRIDTRKQFTTEKGFFGIASSPLVEGNAVILNMGGSDRAGVVAFDSATGKVLWKATQQEASYSSAVSASIGGKRRVFVLGRSALVALDPAVGKVLWEFPFRPRIQASVSAATPLIIGEQIFISASYGAGAALLRYDESKPEVIWSGDDILSNHYATSVHHDGFLYGFDGRQEQRCHLRCVELKTGRVRWSEDRFGAGAIIVVRDQLMIFSERGELILANAVPDKFSVTARAQILGSDCRAHPALAHGRFYARDKQQWICVELRPQ
jgi:outer membrane protein assembly factor BamB